MPATDPREAWKEIQQTAMQTIFSDEEAYEAVRSMRDRAERLLIEMQGWPTFTGPLKRKKKG